MIPNHLIFGIHLGRYRHGNIFAADYDVHRDMWHKGVDGKFTAPNKAKRIIDIKHILSNNDNSESIKYSWNSYVWLVCILEAGRTHKCEMENAHKLDDDGNIELQRPNCTNL